ncbi:carbohydrate kinase family protein [bacterium]|nr:carbohydrate kinase family protein [bacterium]
MKKYDVVGIGGATVDHLNVVDHFPEEDEKIVPLSSSIQGGGQAANTIACMARLGAKTAMIGTVGSGAIGQYAIDSLKEEGVDTGCMIVQKEHAPALSSIIIDKGKGTRAIIADRGDLEKFVICNEMYDVIRNAKIIHSDAHFPEENMELLKFARKNGVKVCIDSEPHTPNAKEFVNFADYLLVSRRFVEKLFSHDYEKALKEFIKRGAEIAVITLGKYGAIGMQKGDEQCTSIKAYPIDKVVDTTGAGDIFHGAFLYGILHGFDLKQNMQFATVAAGLKCRTIGGRRGMPTLNEVEEVLRNWKD